MWGGAQTAGAAAWGAHVAGEPLAEATGRYWTLSQNVLYHLKRQKQKPQCLEEKKKKNFFLQ